MRSEGRRSSASPTKTPRRWLTCAIVFPLAAFSSFASPPLAAAATLEFGKLPPAATRTVDFTNDIKPIFVAHCVQCHGADKQRSGLRLDHREAALKGGENHAPAIKPNNSAESPLIHF